MKKHLLASLVLLMAASGTSLAQDMDDDLGTTDDSMDSTYGAPAEPEPASAPAAEASSGWMEGTKGLFFGVPSGGGSTFGMAYFLDPMAALRLEAGLGLTKPDGGTRNWLFARRHRMYKKVVDKVHVFYQAGAFIGATKGSGDFGGRFQLALTGGIGVEYAFTPQWTVSGVTGGSLAFSQKFKQIDLSTGTSVLYVNWYW